MERTDSHELLVELERKRIPEKAALAVIRKFQGREILRHLFPGEPPSEYASCIRPG